MQSSVPNKQGVLGSWGSEVMFRIKPSEGAKQGLKERFGFRSNANNKICNKNHYLVTYYTFYMTILGQQFTYINAWGTFIRS